MLIGIFNPLGAQSDRLRCEVCQNLILSPMNTGLLRYAVATAPTVYGIETIEQLGLNIRLITMLQQHLPFTVLKPQALILITGWPSKLQQHLPFTVLKRDLKGSLAKESRLRCNSTYRLRY